MLSSLKETPQFWYDLEQGKTNGKGTENPRGRQSFQGIKPWWFQGLKLKPEFQEEELTLTNRDVLNKAQSLQGTCRILRSLLQAQILWEGSRCRTLQCNNY